MKFRLVFCDPPWTFNDSLSMSTVKRGAVSNYPLLSTNEIKKLDVQSLADPDGCVLVLWVVNSLLQDGLDVMKAWGFEQKQIYSWVKTKKEKKNIILAPKDSLTMGMGRLFRNCGEICLIGINNTKVYKHLKNKSQRNISFAFNEGHSKKPEHLQDSLELMFGSDCAKLEMFARRQRDGWLSIGNEVCAGQDIRDSVKDLIEL